MLIFSFFLSFIYFYLSFTFESYQFREQLSGKKRPFLQRLVSVMAEEKIVLQTDYKRKKMQRVILVCLCISFFLTAYETHICGSGIRLLDCIFNKY